MKKSLLVPLLALVASLSWALAILNLEKTRKLRLNHKRQWPSLKQDRPYSNPGFAALEAAESTHV